MVTEIRPLPDSIVSCINNFIKDQKISTTPLIKDSIFKLLDKHCTVLYYPQENEENDGCLVKRIVNNKEEKFVYINTSKSIEKQVFTAAHELGHVLKLEEYVKRNSGEYNQNLDDYIMNRFAAAILMPKDVFLDRFQDTYKYYIDSNDTISKINLINFSLSFMDYFFVPFKAVIIRFYEIGFLSKNVAEDILKDRHILHSINEYIKNLGYKIIGIHSQIKYIEDFPRLLDIVEKDQIFNQTKIDSIRKKMGFKKIENNSLNKSINIKEPIFE